MIVLTANFLVGCLGHVTFCGIKGSISGKLLSDNKWTCSHFHLLMQVWSHPLCATPVPKSRNPQTIWRTLAKDAQHAMRLISMNFEKSTEHPPRQLFRVALFHRFYYRMLVAFVACANITSQSFNKVYGAVYGNCMQNIISACYVWIN